MNGINLLLIDFLLPPSGAQYVKCRAQSCTEGDRQYLFPGHVDTNSLVVQDEYVFTQVCIATDYLSSISIVAFIFLLKGYCLGELWFLFTYFFVFIFAPLCSQFTLFHQTPHNGFSQHTCSPPAQYVFWLRFFFPLIRVRARLGVSVSAQT